jgi:hypothetical protein
MASTDENQRPHRQKGEVREGGVAVKVSVDACLVVAYIKAGSN